MKWLSLFILCLWSLCSYAQGKWDYQWILGHDTSAIDPGGDAVLINFNHDPPIITGLKTVNGFSMEGSNASFSTNDGILKLYSNGCYIVNPTHMIMENGDSINPGIVEDFFCPSGGSPISQSAIALPFPSRDDLAYVFNLDLGLPYFQIDSFTGVAPQKLFYHLIDLEANSGNGRVIEKMWWQYKILLRGVHYKQFVIETPEIGG